MATGASTRRSRGAAGRCPQGRAAADPAAFADLLAARHPPCRARGQQARSRRIRPRRVRRDRRPITPQFAADLGFASLVDDPALGAPRRQPDRALAAHALVSRGRACSNISKRSTSTEAAAGAAVPLPGAMGQPPESRIPRVFGHRRRPARSRPATRSWSWARRAPRGSRRSSRSTARCARAIAGDAVTLTLEDEIDIARGDLAGASRSAVPNSPTSSPRISSG